MGEDEEQNWRTSKRPSVSHVQGPKSVLKGGVSNCRGSAFLSTAAAPAYPVLSSSRGGGFSKDSWLMSTWYPQCTYRLNTDRVYAVLGRI